MDPAQETAEAGAVLHVLRDLVWSHLGRKWTNRPGIGRICGEFEEFGDRNGDRLSSREIEILAGVAQGLLNKEIAAKYNISIHTVITHRKNIARKTGIKTIAGLTAYAILNNII
ncbi:MAG: helix-turn-helix transcriptional regulator [Bacteroidales bacterium]|nr:helix-turn-helix transcriptional regulator [Bacteroidales bacterium]